MNGPEQATQRRHLDEATMRFILAGLCLCCATASAHAQIFIGGGGFDRGLRPGYNAPSDGEPFSHRYGYSTDMTSFYFGRSEEHTSELQSLRHLVCRLL